MATRPAADAHRPGAEDDHGLHLAGFLVFLDPPKQDAAEALRRMADLGITVKVVTGDNPAVAGKVCRDLGLGEGDALTGADLDALDDARLATAIAGTTVFARVSPEHKARIVRAQRRSGRGSPSSATGSTTRSRSTRPMWASRSNRPPTSPKTPPT